MTWKWKKLEYPDILKVWKYAMYFFWSFASDITFCWLPGNRNFPLHSLINKSAVNGYVRAKPYPWVSTHHTSLPLEWLHCRFLMLLFAGGGLWKTRLVAADVPTTSGAWYLTEFILPWCGRSQVGLVLFISTNVSERKKFKWQSYFFL